MSKIPGIERHLATRLTEQHAAVAAKTKGPQVDASKLAAAAPNRVEASRDSFESTAVAAAAAGLAQHLPGGRELAGLAGLRQTSPSVGAQGGPGLGKPGEAARTVGPAEACLPGLGRFQGPGSVWSAIDGMSHAQGRANFSPGAQSVLRDLGYRPGHGARSWQDAQGNSHAEWRSGGVSHSFVESAPRPGEGTSQEGGTGGGGLVNLDGTRRGRSSGGAGLLAPWDGEATMKHVVTRGAQGGGSQGTTEVYDANGRRMNTTEWTKDRNGTVTSQTAAEKPAEKPAEAGGSSSTDKPREASGGKDTASGDGGATGSSEKPQDTGGKEPAEAGTKKAPGAGPGGRPSDPASTVRPDTDPRLGVPLWNPGNLNLGDGLVINPRDAAPIAGSGPRGDARSLGADRVNPGHDGTGSPVADGGGLLVPRIIPEDLSFDPEDFGKG